MSKRAKQLRAQKRRLSALEDEALGRIYMFHEVPPMRFAGTIEQYLDLVAQRLKAEAEPDDPPEWDEGEAQLIAALHEEYQAGRVTFLRSPDDDLVYGLELAPLPLQRPIRGILSTEWGVAA